MTYDFDRIIERRGTGSNKWEAYPTDVLPLWVADMDFPAPDPILTALRERVDHGIFGYEAPPKILEEVVARRVDRLYGWQVTPEMVIVVPGIVTGVNLAAGVVCTPGEGILMQPPVYFPFLGVHENLGLVRQLAPLTQINDKQTLRYEVDFAAFSATLNSGGARTRLFLLCQPHNPTGQIYSREQLSCMAEICLRNDVLICSDEIHSELVLGNPLTSSVFSPRAGQGSTQAVARHIPIATLSPEIAARTITLVAPSKTFNLPGLYCGFAIIPDGELRERYTKEVRRMTLHVSSLAMVAAQAALSGECDEWLSDLRCYLTANRDFLVAFVKENLPGIRTTIPEATYLAWLDCNELVKSGQINGSPYTFFLHKAKVALNDGVAFGPGGEGCVRLNFGCTRATLVEALQRMEAALHVG